MELSIYLYGWVLFSLILFVVTDLVLCTAAKKPCSLTAAHFLASIAFVCLILNFYLQLVNIVYKIDKEEPSALAITTTIG